MQRVVAALDRVEVATRPAPVGSEWAEVHGVLLGFLPRRGRVSDPIEDFAELGPELSVPAVESLGRVLRVLRAARIALPEPVALVGRPERAAALLERARGTLVHLEVRPRSRLRFTAWTETGVETVDHVSDVLEHDDAYLVLRRGAQVPVRLPRERVVRRITTCERWYEVVRVERA